MAQGYSPLSSDETDENQRQPTKSYFGRRLQTMMLENRAILAIKTFLVVNCGLILVVGSQASLSLVNVAVKKLNTIDPPVPVFELILIRQGVTYAFSMAYMLYTGVENPYLGPKGVRFLLFLRGFFGFFGVFGVYEALQYLSLSDATVLTFLSPLCTALAGALFLNEKFVKSQAFAGLFSLLGVILIARPASLFGSAADILDPEFTPEDSQSSSVVPNEATSEQRLLAVGVSLLGVLGSTGAYTSIRAIGKRAHHMHSMSSFALQCVIVTSVGMIVTRTPFVLPTRWLWALLLLVIGVFGFTAQVLLTMGLQREAAGRATMAIYTQIVFASIFERIWFHTTPSLLSIIGTLIIIGSALYVALTKEREGGNEDTAITLERLDTDLEEGLLEQSRREAEDKPQSTLEVAQVKKTDFVDSESTDESSPRSSVSQEVRVS
ncbi:hypothetical protein VNI00_002781 [Paramarasmius palmivorus]|uniref:EamA domain-containing protein n=1 Tax=Paramarasmius palmivorus TaxID=297713 RepID=A0AAW0DZ63_9AGAR